LSYFQGKCNHRQEGKANSRRKQKIRYIFVVPFAVVLLWGERSFALALARPAVVRGVGAGKWLLLYS